MAVPKSPTTPSKTSQTKIKKTPNKPPSAMASPNSPTTPGKASQAKIPNKPPSASVAKRTTNPGVRIIGGRIYDSEHGKTCHQCRQKTRDFTAACTKIRHGKLCPIQYCHKCLINRYGEKAEEMAKVEDWGCPKCRGVCNCSFCMKKKGHAPTGILVHAAKKTGCSSVSELLKRKESVVGGTENVVLESPLKSKKESIVRKRSSDKVKNHDEQTTDPEVEMLDFSATKERKKKPSKKSKTENGSEPATDPVVEVLDFSATKERKKKPSKKSKTENGSEPATDPVVEVSDFSATKESKKKPSKKIKTENASANGLELSQNVASEPATDVTKKGVLPGSKKRKVSVGVDHGNSEAKLLKVGKQKQKSADSVDKLEVHLSEKMLDLNSPAEVKQPQVYKPKQKTDESVDKPKVNLSEKMLDLKSIPEAVPPEAKQPKVHKQKQKAADSVDKLQVNLSEKTLELNSTPEEGSPCDPEMGLLTDGSKDKPLEKVRRRRKHNIDRPIEPEREDVVLPQGTPLRMVAGVEFQEKDVGEALQFLEFCNAFSKVLDLQKGQPEALLREIATGRTGRRSISPIVQFHIKLLAIIQKDIGEKPLSCSPRNDKSWLQALSECTKISECALKELPLERLSKGPLVYDDWDLSNKLKLLNLLCDETLSTSKLRGWIDKEHTKFVENRREVSEKVIAARKREKDLKRKMKDDMAKTMVSSAPLTIAEHDNLVSKIKTETEKAHLEMLESLNLLPKKKQRPSAVRTEPVLLEGSGHAYWKLKGCCSSSNIYLQDIGTWDLIVSSEKWFIYNEEEEKMIDKVLSPLRHGKVKRRYILKGKALDVGRADEEQNCTEKVNSA